jgi:hypothetical protein
MYHTSQQRNPVVVVLLDCGMLKFTLSGSCSMKLAWIVETPQHPMERVGTSWELINPIPHAIFLVVP